MSKPCPACGKFVHLLPDGTPRPHAVPIAKRSTPGQFGRCKASIPKPRQGVLQ